MPIKQKVILAIGTILILGLLFVVLGKLARITGGSPQEEQTLGATVLMAPQGGTGLSSYVRGDIVAATNTNSLVKVPAGATNTVMTMVNGMPSWATPAAGGGTITSSTWQYNQTNATIYPTTSTYDVLIGGSNSSTASFVFDVTGSGTGYATVPSIQATGSSAFGNFGGYPTVSRFHSTSTLSAWGICNTVGGTYAAPAGIGCYGPNEDGSFSIFTVSSTDNSLAALLYMTGPWQSAASLAAFGLDATGTHITGSLVPYYENNLGSLGSPLFGWKNVYASGTAYSANVVANGPASSTFNAPVSSTRGVFDDRVAIGQGLGVSPLTINAKSQTNVPSLSIFNIGAGAGGVQLNPAAGGSLTLGDTSGNNFVTDVINRSLNIRVMNQAYDPTSDFDIKITADANPLKTVLWLGGSTGQTADILRGYTEFASTSPAFRVSATGNVHSSGTIFATTDVQVNGVSVCLSNGTNCPAGSGVTNLQQAIVAGPTATSTPTFLGGIVMASSTATGTLNLPAQNATALLFTDSSRAVSSTSRITVNGNSGSVTTTNIFASVASSTNLFSNVGNIGTLTVGNLTANQSTSTIISWTSASGSSLLVAGQTVCLANGVNCPFASISDTNAGTSTLEAVTPDSLAGSVFGTKSFGIDLTTSTNALLAINGSSNTSTCRTLPATYNGMNLVAVLAAHGVAGSGGTSTQIQVRNADSGADMLTVPVHIDPGERKSTDAATQPVINTSNDGVATGDRICADVDAVENTPGKETQIVLTFQLP
jgi:hypothetical protein